MSPSRTASTDADDWRDEPLDGLIGAIWRQRLTALAVFAITMAIGVLVIVLSPVRYQASTSILLDPRLGKTVGADPTIPGFVADSSAIDSQIKLLTSQTVLSRVATSLHLDEDPEFSGKRFSLMRFLGFSAPSPTGADLKALESAISIKRPERTYVVEITVSAASPDKAAAIANSVADAYNDDQVSSRVVSTRNDSKFIAQKREQLRKQIDDADHRIEDYKRANNIVSTDGLRSNEQQVADLTRELGTARGRASELKARAEQIATVARSGKLDASADALKSPTVERLRGQQAETERELAKLSQTLGPLHPAVQESQAQVQRVRELIGAELIRLRQAAEGEYQSERRNENQLVADLDRIKRQATDTSSRIVPLRQMEREVDALRASDDRFARIGDTLTQQEGDTPPARVVAAARPPVSPSWPRRSLILGVAAGAGLFFGLGAALFRDGLQRPRPVRTAVPAPSIAAPPSSRGFWDDESATDGVTSTAAAPVVKAEQRNAAAEKQPADPIGAPDPIVAPESPAATRDDAERDYYKSLRTRHRPRGRLVWS